MSQFSQYTFRLKLINRFKVEGFVIIEINTLDNYSIISSIQEFAPLTFYTWEEISITILHRQIYCEPDGTIV